MSVQGSRAVVEVYSKVEVEGGGGGLGELWSQIIVSGLLGKEI